MEICECGEPIKWIDAFTKHCLNNMNKCSKCFVQEYWEELEGSGDWKEN